MPELSFLIKARDDASVVLRNLNKELKTSSREWKRDYGELARTAGITMAAMSASLIAIGAKSVKTYSDMGEEISNMAQKTGFSTEALSVLRYAAEKTGVAFSSFEGSVKGMANFLNQASTGTAAAGETLRRLGVSMASLKGLSPEATFARLSSAVNSIKDPLQRAALAQEVFGRSGVDILPLLAQDMTAVTAEAKAMGIVFNQQAADTASEFNNSITQLKGSLIGLQNQIARAVIPIIQPLTDAISGVITAMTKWSAEHPALSKAIGAVMVPLAGFMAGAAALLLSANGLSKAWQILVWVFGGIAAAIGAPVAAVVAAAAAIGAAVYLIVDNWDWIKEHWETIWSGITAAAQSVFGPLGAVLVTMSKWALEAITDWDAFAQRWKDLWEDIKHWPGDAWEWIKNTWNSVASWFSDNVIYPVVGAFRWLWDKVSGFFSSLWDGIKSIWSGVSGWFQRNVIDPIVKAFRWLWDEIKDIWHKIFGGGTPSISTQSHVTTPIPGYAQGGVVPGPMGAPMLAMVHGGEMITPAGRGGGSNIYVTINTSPGTDIKALAQEIRRELVKIKDRNVTTGL